MAGQSDDKYIRGAHGFSFGWINRELIASGKAMPHINPYGGEERLWLGPEEDNIQSSSKRAMNSFMRTGRLLLP